MLFKLKTRKLKVFRVSLHFEVFSSQLGVINRQVKGSICVGGVEDLKTEGGNIQALTVECCWDEDIM